MDKVDKLFYYEPNPNNNELIPNEDISIYVNLETTTKGRSIVRLSDIEGVGKIINTGGKTTTLKFIDSKEDSLTTSYTQVSSLLDDDADIETLGIDSIDIDFDTAYTPLIKIKFIDVRGTSILQKGDKSKYRMFFDLPYPIFSLTVKGYYGKPVKYCLHLLKWNAKFNSDTGNFEIETEFIGYTYAILTDLLLGYLRAVVYTDEGSKVFKKYKEEYARQNIELKTIDDFLDDIHRLSDEFKKIKNDDSNVKSLNTIEVIRDGIEIIKNKLDTLYSFIIPTGTEYFNNGRGIIVISSKPDTSIIDGAVSNYKEDIDDILNKKNTGLNPKIQDASLKFDKTKVTTFIKTEELNFEDFSGNLQKAKDAIYSQKKYDINDESNPDNKVNSIVDDLANEIINNLPKNTTGGKITIYDFRGILNELDRVKTDLKTTEKDIRLDIGEKLRNIATDKLDFDPTIRNIFRLFTTHCEIFLETLTNVSKAAENSDARAKVLESLVTNNRTNLRTNTSIYPWPEIRENKNGTFEESWIGSNLTLNEKQKVNELVFVEDLLAQLLQIGKKDEQVILEGGLNGDQYYPISPLDTIIANNGNINPYKTALYDGSSRGVKDEATRCLLMRGFLGLGVSNKNYPDELVRPLGTLEAYNLFNAIVNNSDKRIATDLLNSINGSESLEAKRNNLLTLWKEGVEDIKNPFDVKTPLLFQKGQNYVYSYIRNPNSNINSFNNEKVYLPINNNFDGRVFYNSSLENFKSNNDLRVIGSSTNFTSNNYGTNQNNNDTDSLDDGATFFKIISSDEYAVKVNQPDFGGDFIQNKYRNVIPEGLILKQSTFPSGTYVNGKVIGFLDPYGGQLQAQEIFNITYDGTSSEGSNNNYKGVGEDASVLCAFWNQKDYSVNGITSTYGGTYLAVGNDDVEQLDYSLLKGINTANRNAANLNRRVVMGTVYEGDTSTNQYGQQRNLIGDLLKESNNSGNANLIYTPYIEFGIANNVGISLHHFSLFGSEFYYRQKTDEARAFLFLHTFGWHGLIGDVGDSASLFDLFDENGELRSFGSDDTPTIKSIFKNNAAFINAPKLWCAFIGGLIYRYEQIDDIIDFGDEINGFPLPWQDKDSYVPNKSQYLYDTRSKSSFGMNFMFDAGDIIRQDDEPDNYKNIDTTLINLPIQIKKEFIRIFQLFVDNDFVDIRSELELFPDDVNKNIFNTTVNNLLGIVEDIEFPSPGGGVGTKRGIYKKNLPDIFNTVSKDVVDNYESITPTSGSTITPWATDQFHINLVLKPKNNITRILNNLVTSNYVVLNGSPQTFRDSNSNQINDNRYSDLSVPVDKMEKFLDSFFSTLGELINERENSIQDKNDELEKAIFNSVDDDLIKLNIYRTLGSIYTKWLSGTDSVFNQCSDSTNGTGKLIDTFKFLDRSFSDIGDKFYINPIAIDYLVRGNFNQSFFDLTNRILSDNYFNFIALPTFLDFTDIQQMQDMFTPYSYNDLTADDYNAGPSFICTYVGQVSTNLDLGDDTNYGDDGVYIEIDSNGKIAGGIPPDFTDDGNPNSINIPMVGVSYGRQNQNFFKDIRLDQREFTETSESLEIIEDISQGGDKRKANYIGQNLFNVYQTRSYSAEIEMMGNAMMQPMMYFQLNNIPMFRGAYMIIKVSHNIKANSMTTKFKGVRIKRTKTPLIDAPTLFMNLLGSLEGLGSADVIADTTPSTTGITIVPVTEDDNIIGIIIEG